MRQVVTHTYLRDLSAKSVSCGTAAVAGYYVMVLNKSNKSSENLLMELTRFAYQISRGMEFLSSMNVIHRDLAARNILLNSRKTAKVADFGMAKTQPEYILERQLVPLPVCWMAPEAIIPGRGVFTTAGDVWSFGVVLWEIFTLAQTPYVSEFPKGVLFEQLCNFLREGHRLELPAICPHPVRSVAKECWNFKPEDRPDFAEISRILEHLMRRKDEINMFLSLWRTPSGI
ncbi:tyrosine-protein kinase receptor Tie-1-like [Paramacrobiotus metropolitanus]|uniref:tyrosine-protein kinase receptor Tie-1-like n=1 Tax=Paramacrobiotus metropolitanus TaxID=2943436 RepID=UPI002445B320|nr:tyrosine-protein kinase receptor Tie-1-like [Paramacrobiotus metropolitanus]